MTKVQKIPKQHIRHCEPSEAISPFSVFVALKEGGYDGASISRKREIASGFALAMTRLGTFCESVRHDGSAKSEKVYLSLRAQRSNLPDTSCLSVEQAFVPSKTLAYRIEIPIENPSR